MVAPDTAAHSETHRDTKEREPVKLGLHATVNPDTLPFTYAKDKHALTFTVENTGEGTEIFKIKTTASYLYRIRPVYFKLAVRERQEVSVTYKGADAGPIPLSAKDRITVVFAHALDPRKSIAALWDLHKPFAHLSYAESREYVRVLFVDETGRLAVSAAHEKSRGGLDQRSIQGRSITMKPEPPRRVSAERDMTNEAPTAEEKSNNADNEADAPQPVRAAPAKTPRSPGAAARSKQSAAAAAAARTPSPARVTPSPKETKRSPASGRSRDRDPIQSILSSVAKDASAIVCVQYPGNGYSKERDEDSTVADEKTKDEDTNKNDAKTVRDMDTDGRRDEVLRKKMDEMRRREDEEKTRRKRDEEKKEERKKSEEERKRKDEEREERKRKEEEKEERKRKEEEKEERKRKEEEREERKRKEEERDERKKKDEEREEKRRAEEEDRRKKAEEEAAEEEKAKTRRSPSNEEVKQEQTNEEQQTTSSARRRRVLGADGNYHDDDSRYLDEEIRRKNASVRMLKKGARTASRDNSQEDENRPRRTSLEEDN